MKPDKHPGHPGSIKRLLVVMPTWIGDAVMATPTLRALRELCPDAQITALVRETVRPIVDGCPWLDRVVKVRRSRKRGSHKPEMGPVGLAQRLAKGQFDTAVLLPNSFRSALVTRMAGIPRRVGYDRDGRGFLLTDRLLARRSSGRFVPVPTRDYYLGLARYLGAVNPDPAMGLFTKVEDDAKADQILKQAGYDPASHSVASDGAVGRPLVLINPGANYGDAKMWHPQRFAEVADRCVREFGAVTAVTGAPKERGILDQVLQAAKEPMLDLPGLGVDLTLLKSVVGRSSLMITNDTGPRHMATAMKVPVVTVFGPTDPAWTHTGFEAERQVMVPVFCGPCQKKKCPLDHRCMTLIEPQMVFDQAVELLGAAQLGGVGASA